MLDLGLRVTVNTDDPGVMGNRHLNEVITDTAAYLDLNREQLVRLARNSFEGLWLPDEDKSKMLTALNDFELTNSEGT